MNPNGRYPNNHARGTFTVEGWAAEWIKRHKEEMARLTPDQLQLYFQAMDQLYLQAEKVIIIWPYKIIKNFDQSILSKNYLELE